MVTQEELDQKVEQFKAQFGDKYDENRISRNNLTLLLSHNDDSTDHILLFFPDDLKINVKVIRRYFEQMQDANVLKAIIVVKDSLTPYAIRAMKQIAPKYTLEHFIQSELEMNITKHHLVPVHIPLTSEEKNELLTKYKMKESALMKILHSDPVARYFGLKRGQVVKIIRPSETAGRYILYRLVV